MRSSYGIAAVLAAALTTAPTSVARAQPGGDTPEPVTTPRSDAATLEWTTELEGMMARYEQASVEQDTRMRALLLREYNRRLAQLNQRYAARLAGATDTKRKRQLEAIVLLEKFIKDHPTHELHTPDAMYRLAALYLDEAEMVADEAEIILNADYSKPLVLWERIIREFPQYRQIGATMYLYATYIGTREVTDPIEERRAIQVYRALVCANKFKPFDAPPPMLEREDVQLRLSTKVLINPYQDCTPVPDTDAELISYGWVRGVGANHFATPGEMDEAIAAFAYGLSDESHKLYDEALYMSAWSYYRRDILDVALDLFDKSVIRYDKTVAAGAKPSLKLRDEALLYIAVTLTDPWDGEIDTDPDKAWERATRFYGGRENEPHVREVWITLGKAFGQLGGPAMDRGIDSYRKALSDPWHLHPDNPVLHQEIVNILERRGDREAANEVRAEIATRYSPCPEEKKRTRAPEDPCGRWYEANETNRKAMENYRKIGERMLEIAALTTHQQAIDVHTKWSEAPDGAPDKAELDTERLRLFAEALDHYRTFIETYPASKNTYVFTYGIAEVLFYMGRYVDQPGPGGEVGPDQEGAVRHYRWVRDHKNLSKEFFEDSVFKIVKSLELHTDWMVAANQLRKLEVPNLTPIPAPEPVPAPHAELRQAYDDYATLVNQAAKAPRMAFNAGLVSMSYYELDDAIARFGKVMRNFCGTPESLRAKEAILAIYGARQDDQKFRDTNAWFIKQKCGDAKSIEAAQTQNRKLSLKAAERLADTNQLADAAQAYYQYYVDAPVEDDERAAALYNAAQLYENAGQPRRALYLFKEFSTKSESKDKENQIFRDSPYRLPALMLYADSFGNSYDYTNAARKYLDIYKMASAPTRYGVKPPKAYGDEKAPTFDELRRQTLFNAAAFYELDRDFTNAIKYYKEYEKIETDRRKQDRAAWSVARIYKAQNKLSDLENAWSSWRKKYGNDRGNDLDVLTTYYELAGMYAKKAGTANRKKADGLRTEAIKSWESTKWDSAEPIARVQAAKMAGELDFYFAEQHYLSKWVPAKMVQKRTTKENGVQKAALENKALEAIGKFDDVANKYKRYTLEYAAAGKVRVGQIYLDFYGKILTMPMPKDVIAMDKKSPGFLARVEQGLRAELDGKGYREVAKKEFLNVVEVAKDPNVVVPKKWVAMAKDELNKEFGESFPILNEELTEGTVEP
jgi:hypothetical protein